MNKFYINCLIVLAFLSALTAKSQSAERLAGVAKYVEVNSKDQVTYVYLKEDYNVYETNAEAFLNTVILNNNDIKVKKLRTDEDNIGYTHTRFQLLYKNVLIDNSIIIVHSKDGKIVSLNGDVDGFKAPVNSVSLSGDKALQLALAKVNAKKYKWEDKADEENMKRVLNNPNFTFYPTADLILYSDHSKKLADKSAYAYKFNIYAETPLYRANVIVDAQSGKILAEQNLLCTSDVTATAITKYSGTQTIGTDMVSAGNYRLREVNNRGLGVETYNLKNGTSYGAAVDFTNTTTSWTTTGVDQAATDAHWGCEMTYDFYKTALNRNSVDNAGYKLLSYVHYSTGYNNAFWDGLRMTYGDGSGSYQIFTALDVCGHEVSHGLTSNTSNLTYSNESGALNESNSDIMGTCIENYGRPTNWNWKIGEDFTISGNGIRNMSNPNQFNHPDTYLGTFWYTGTGDNGGVHTNSGVNNFWFYLLSQGGTGTNDISNSYTVTGITMAKAIQIQYRALTYYYTPSTNYANARLLTIQAAKDLYGACSNEVKQTTNAWYAVGVGAAYVNTLTTNFNSLGTSICALPANVLFKNTSVNGFSYLWNFGDGTTSTAQDPLHTYTANGTYSVKLKTTGCLSIVDSITKTAYITVATPPAPTATGAAICGPASANLTASGGTNYWYATPTPTGTPLFIGNNYTTPVISSNTTYYVVNSTTNTPVTGAPTSTAIGTVSNYLGNLEYLIFDVYQPSTLKTVVVYASTTGTRTIELRNSSNAVITSTVVNCALGSNTVALDFALTPGSAYRLGLSSTSQANLYRNKTGAVYPYNIGSLVSITGNSYAQTYYNYFYNWTVVKDNCTSAAVAVTATVTPGPTITVNAPTICNGATANLTANGATTYTWSTGANGASIAVTPTATTVYTVNGSNGGACNGVQTTTVTVTPGPTVSMVASNTLICSGQTTTLQASGATSYTFNPGGITSNPASVNPSSTTTYTVVGATGPCSGTNMITINVSTCAGINEQSALTGMSVYPNPANSVIYINFNGNQYSKAIIEVTDAIGKVVIKKQSDNLNNLPISVSELSNGIYIVSITVEGKRSVKKFIKQ